ncbi:hypothetical protein NMY22_g8808 [Coprinellus aureogranulatus]|nr:hypothetical protein NMY22_g8808 [Coprinellus aureogranulatus]
MATSSALPQVNQPQDEAVVPESSRDTGALPAPSPRDWVLSNRDILSTIFKNFVPTTRPNPHAAVERRFLLSLALQCKAFSEPALDYLWEHLESLTPLIRVIPSAVLVDGKYFLSGPASNLSPAFKKYANRVRSYSIRNQGSFKNAPVPKPDSSVYILLSQLLVGAPIFPGLQTLHIVSSADSCRHAIPLILPCPSLARIKLGRQLLADAMALRLTIPLVVSRTPSLKELSLHWNNHPGNSLGDIISSIFPLRLLEVLTITGGSSAVPQRFLLDIGSNFRHLRKLNLDLVLQSVPLEAIPAVAEDQSSVDSRLFPNLEWLSLAHRSKIHMMQCHDIPSLVYNVSTLALNFRREWFPSMPRIVEVLSGCPVLRSLTLFEDKELQIPVDNIVLLLTRLKLDQLHLRMSRVLQATLTTARDTGDTITILSAQSCMDRILTAAAGLQQEPKPLRSLTLPLQWLPKHAPLTLLGDVARKARDLESLRIPIDSFVTSSSMADITAQASNPSTRRPSAMKFLQIHDTRTSETTFTPTEYRDLAQYIDFCFPNLVSMELAPASDAPVPDLVMHQKTDVAVSGEVHD